MERIAAIVVASDSRSTGQRADLTGPAAAEALAAIGERLGAPVVVEAVVRERLVLAPPAPASAATAMRRPRQAGSAASRPR